MGRASGELDALGDHAVAAAAEGDPALVGVARGVGHHGDVHVVQGPGTDELGLASEKLNPALPSQVVAILYLDVLLGGHGHQGDAPGEVLQDSRGHEARRDPQHHADLAVVAAGVGRVGIGVRMGMADNLEGVQLAHDGYGGAGGAPVQHPLQTGDGDAALVRDAHVPKSLGHQPGGLLLAEARLRVGEDRLGGPDKLVAAPVYLGLNGSL